MSHDRIVGRLHAPKMEAFFSAAWSRYTMENFHFPGGIWIIGGIVVDLWYDIVLQWSAGNSTQILTNEQRTISQQTFPSNFVIERMILFWIFLCSLQLLFFSSIAFLGEVLQGTDFIKIWGLEEWVLLECFQSINQSISLAISEMVVDIVSFILNHYVNAAQHWIYLFMSLKNDRCIVFSNMKLPFLAKSNLLLIRWWLALSAWHRFCLAACVGVWAHKMKEGRHRETWGQFITQPHRKTNKHIHQFTYLQTISQFASHACF